MNSGNVSRPSSSGLPWIIAHRGASHAAPENTLASFRLAWGEGADGIEGDFHLSADGEVVCIHDADTARVAGEKLVVAETPWRQLSELDAGSWKAHRYAGERIPLLAEVLDLVAEGKRLFAEIKGGIASVESIQRVIERKKVNPQKVVLMSFDEAVVKACREKLPAFQTHWISDLKEIDKSDNGRRYLARLEATGAQGLQFNAKAPVSKEWLASLREKNFQLTSWTVDELDLARKMIGYGVDHITTNRPGDLRKELAGG